MLYKIKEFSELTGISKATLRRWDAKGKLKAIKLVDSKYRYYEFSHLVILFGEEKAREMILNV